MNSTLKSIILPIIILFGSQSNNILGQNDSMPLKVRTTEFIRVHTDGILKAGIATILAGGLVGGTLFAKKGKQLMCLGEGSLEIFDKMLERAEKNDDLYFLMAANDNDEEKALLQEIIAWGQPGNFGYFIGATPRSCNDGVLMSDAAVTWLRKSKQFGNNLRPFIRFMVGFTTGCIAAGMLLWGTVICGEYAGLSPAEGH